MKTEIKYRDKDEKNCTCFSFFYYGDFLMLEDIGEALADWIFSSGDFDDPDCWPINYEIYLDGAWQEVELHMEYTPHFSCVTELPTRK